MDYPLQFRSRVGARDALSPFSLLSHNLLLYSYKYYGKYVPVKVLSAILVNQMKKKFVPFLILILHVIAH